VYSRLAHVEAGVYLSLESVGGARLNNRVH
jgi:hypothetical protein